MEVHFTFYSDWWLMIYVCLGAGGATSRPNAVVGVALSAPPALSPAPLPPLPMRRPLVPPNRLNRLLLGCVDGDDGDDLDDCFDSDLGVLCTYWYTWWAHVTYSSDIELTSPLPPPPLLVFLPWMNRSRKCWRVRFINSYCSLTQFLTQSLSLMLNT